MLTHILAPFGLVGMLHEANHQVSLILVIAKVYDLISLILMLYKKPFAIVLSCLVGIPNLVYQQVSLIRMLCNVHFDVSLIAVIT